MSDPLACHSPVSHLPLWFPREALPSRAWQRRGAGLLPGEAGGGQGLVVLPVVPGPVPAGGREAGRSWLCWSAAWLGASSQPLCLGVPTCGMGTWTGYLTEGYCEARAREKGPVEQLGHSARPAEVPAPAAASTSASPGGSPPAFPREMLPRLAPSPSELGDRGAGKAGREGALRGLCAPCPRDWPRHVGILGFLEPRGRREGCQPAPSARPS